jgi:hypothetical protein
MVKQRLVAVAPAIQVMLMRFESLRPVLQPPNVILRVNTTSKRMPLMSVAESDSF